MRKILLTLCFICVALFILFGCSHNKNKDLSKIKSRDQLVNILKQYNGHGIYAATAEDNKATDQPTSGSSTDYSKTNTQVDGVDEADVVKTDGDNIYLVSQNKVIITHAYPVSEMQVIATLDYYDTGFYPSTLFVDDEHLVVIGTYYKPVTQPDTKGGYLYHYFPKSITKVMVYDKGNYTNPTSEMSLDGYAITTRKINNELLLITNQYINYWMVEQDKEVDLRPQYKINQTVKTIDYDEIHYKEGTYPNGFVTIMKYNLDTQNESHYTYMGSGDNVYVSMDHIYVSQREYDVRIFNAIEPLSGSSEPEPKDQTAVTKIDVSTLSQTKTIDVRGHINNQFSMDEHNGHFRIVTTHGNTWDNTSENNVYIYNDGLNLVGKIEGIAKGEQIQSARFVGDRIYMVTFRTIDPFFVIDAKDPRHPKILGELKIPGYSTYLHPYDVNHMIGFGFDTSTTIENGREVSRITGLKLSLFDVTDATKPTNTANELLPFGESSYTYSELSYNHKALLFNKAKKLIAFPISTSIYKRVVVNEGGKLYDSYQYLYRQTYQVFQVTLDGFEYKTEISHFDTAQSDDYRYGYEIMRGLYIEDYLYTVSLSKIQVHHLQDYELVNELELDFDEPNYNQWYGDATLE